MPLLLVLFVLFPLLELWLLVEVGDEYGALVPIALVVAAGALGVTLLRNAGWQTVAMAQDQLRRQASPLPALLDGFALVVAGILLVLPGLISDAIAALLLISPLRRWLLRHWRPVTATVYTGSARPDAQESVVIDGDYVVERQSGVVERQSRADGRGEQDRHIEDQRPRDH